MSRTEIGRVLRDASEPMSIADLAARVRLHPNTVRFHLDRLVETGQVEQVEPQRRNPGRPPLLFRATRTMDPTGPRNYQLLAEVVVDALADSPDARELAAEAGRSWWNHHGSLREQAPSEDAIPRLLTLLDDLGFAPQIATESRIDLRHCPFLELTTQSSEGRTAVVCPIHLGLMQGALEQWRAPMSVERLEPLVERDRCVVHLTAAGPTR